MTRSSGRARSVRRGRRVATAWAVFAALFAIATASPAGAAVSAVSGEAYGSYASVSLFGGPPGERGPGPRVTLAPDASNSPQSATAATSVVQYGPATIFTTGPVAVSTQGSLGTGGSVTSTTSITDINTSGQEVFTASSATSTCSAAETGPTGSTTIEDGVLQVSEGDPDVDGDETFVNVPTNPAPNTTYEGELESVGDSFRYTFNEQILTSTGPDGALVLTVFAGHLRLIGPTAVGDLYWGKSECSVTGTGAPATPSITVQASPPNAQLGQPINAVATLSGGANPTGTITFTLYGPADAACAAPPVFSNVIPVSGTGSYTSGPFTPTAAGGYQWVATYSGDANHLSVATACADPAAFTSVAKATPTLSTEATPSAQVGQPISDTATLSGGFNPTGTVTFRLYGPDDATCTAKVFDSTTGLSGGTATSSPFTPSSPGTYRWIATYSGDANNSPAAGACGDTGETTVVSAPPPPKVPDCRVTRIVFESVWVHSEQQQVRIVGGNVGSASARCRVTFEARKINPAGPPAPDYPGSYLVNVAPGGTFIRYFIVTPPRAGTYRVQACARAVNGSGSVIDSNLTNSCRTAQRTAS